MKATIDIPDELYRRVEVKSAIKGRAIPDLTIELLRKWVEEPETDGGDQGVPGKGWADALLAHAVPAGTPGPTARELLEGDRHRLESQE